MNKQIVTTIAVAVVIGAAGFFGGMKYGESKTASKAPSQNFVFNRNGAAGGARRFGSGNNFLTGTVLSKDNGSITVQLRTAPGVPSGSTQSGSKIVILTGSTQIAKAATGTIDDINVGTNVVVTGTDNSDGSLTAQSIQIRPQMATSTPAQ